MFWGITLENGKRYTQVVEKAFHVSMASLEQSSKHKDSFVGIMFEHEKSEFLLCTLQHGTLLQQPMDLNFMTDDTITLYLNGEGIVHLTGYLMEPDEDSSEDEEGDGMREYFMGGRNQLKSAEEGDSEDDDDDDDEFESGSEDESSLMLSRNSARITELGSDDSDEDDSPTVSKPKSTGAKRKAEAGATSGGQAKKSKSDDSSEDDGSDDDMDSDESEDDSDSDADEKPVAKSKPVAATPQKGKLNGPQTPAGADFSAKKNKKQQQQQQPKSLNATPAKNNNNKGGQPQSPKKSPVPVKVEPKTPSQSNGTSPLSKSEKKKIKKAKLLAAKNAGSQPTSPKTPAQKGESPAALTKSEKKKNKGAATPGAPAVISTPKKEQSQPKNAVNKLAGGTQTTDMLVGSGPVAKPGKMVQVYYVGKVGSKEFDSCSKGKPFKFRLGAGEVIKGWDAGVQGMKVGGKRKIVVPPNQGYGSSAQGPIPANSTLDFEVQLISVS